MSKNPAELYQTLKPFLRVLAGTERMGIKTKGILLSDCYLSIYWLPRRCAVRLRPLKFYGGKWQSPGIKFYRHPTFSEFCEAYKLDPREGVK